MHPFRNLLLVAMGRRSSLEKDPTPEVWKRLFVMARQQALIGVLNAAVHRLPDGQQPPADILSEWDRLAGIVEIIYARHERRAVELEDVLARLGFHGSILKGTGLSRLYPEPAKRQCGDIDLWVKGPRKAILEAFCNEYNIHDVLYQECKVEIFDDTEVELHFHPSKMFNPFCNARLQRWFERNSSISEYDVLTYPDSEFNAVFCMAHMYRHYLVGGLGLRQMMDYYYILKNLPAEAREPAFKTLKRLGMKNFTAASMAAVKYNFGLEDEYLLCKPESTRGRRLILDMIEMGNFGVLDARNRSVKDETALARFARRNRRVLSYLRLYPREVLWAPFSRFSQFIWRHFHRYI